MFPHQVVWYLAASMATLATLLTMTLHWGDRGGKGPVRASGATSDQDPKDGECAPLLDDEEGASPGTMPAAAGGRSGADSWTLRRVQSFQSAQERLAGFASMFALPSRGGQKLKSPRGGVSTSYGTASADGRKRATVSDDDDAEGPGSSSTGNDIEQPLLLASVAE